MPCAEAKRRGFFLKATFVVNGIQYDWYRGGALRTEDLVPLLNAKTRFVTCRPT